MNDLLHSVHSVVPPNVSVGQPQQQPTSSRPDLMMQMLIQDQENERRRLSGGSTSTPASGA